MPLAPSSVRSLLPSEDVLGPILADRLPGLPPEPSGARGHGSADHHAGEQRGILRQRGVGWVQILEAFGDMKWQGP